MFLFLALCVYLPLPAAKLVERPIFVEHPIFGFSFDVEKTDFRHPKFNIPGRDKKMTWVVSRYTQGVGKDEKTYIITVSLIQGEAVSIGQYQSDFGGLLLIEGKNVKVLATADGAWYGNDLGMTKGIRTGLAENAIKRAISAFGEKQFVERLMAGRPCYARDEEQIELNQELAKLKGLAWCRIQK